MSLRDTRAANEMPSGEAVAGFAAGRAILQTKRENGGHMRFPDHTSYLRYQAARAQAQLRQQFRAAQATVTGEVVSPAPAPAPAPEPAPALSSAPSSVPDAPVITDFPFKTTTRIDVTFTQVNNSGSAITNYAYSLNGGAFTDLSPVDTTSPITISGLTPGTVYTIKLKAKNANGYSTESEALTDITYANRVVDTITTSGSWTAPEGVGQIQYLIVGGGGGGGASYSNIDVLGSVPLATSKPAGTSPVYWINTTFYNYIYEDNARYNPTKPYRLTVTDPNNLGSFPLSIGGGSYAYNKWYKDEEMIYTGSLPTVTNYFSPYIINSSRCNNISSGGGGGAGGRVRYLSDSTTYSVTPGTSYTVTIGAGGAGGTASAGVESNGSPGGASFFDTIDASGGSGGRYSRDGNTRPTNGWGSGGTGGLEGDNYFSGQGGSGLQTPSVNSNYNKYNSADAGGQAWYIDFDENGTSEQYASGGPGGIPNIPSSVTATANSGNGGSGTGSTLNSFASGRDGASGIVKIKYYTY